ncbi:MAG: tetratricopeptide repeat protein [Nonomuraea sp.]|nr:tetratricopeptide repeat protein [Nonomuraea sp.]
MATRPVQLAPRPPQLVGRDEVVAVLRERLVAGGGRPSVVAVHGLGGVGKTSLALEYAYRFQPEYDLVWQLPAADPAVLSAAFGRLAALMGLRELGDDAADPVDQVHAALAARTEPWLLIFDNAPEAEGLRPFLPPAGPGHVLITSRSGSWPRDQGLELPVLDLGAAARLMLASSGQDDGEAAAAVVAELGALPLALEQAAAYMSETGLSLAEYLDLLHHRRAELLAQGQAWGYRERVTSTWRLAFERLARTSPQAIALLRLLSCYAHEAIPYHLLLSSLERRAPRELFRAHMRRRRAYGRIPARRSYLLLREVRPSVLVMMRELPRDTFRINAALSALRRHSLIGPPVDGTVTVHRLVQAVTIDQLSRRAQRRWREIAAVLVEAVLPDDPAQKARWPRYARLLPHIRTVLDPTSPGMDKTAQYLGASGDYRTARALFREIAGALAAALGPEHPATLRTRHELALWTGEAGDPAGARDQYVALLPVYERVLGPEHPHTLTTRHNLAHWTGRAGDPVAARDRYAALLPIRRRVSGPEHPDTLTTQANLAQWTGQAGDPAAARDQYAALLPVRERVQGSEHPSTLINRHELARWTGELGDAVSARDQYAALLVARERVSGPHHPDTLTIRHELARWTGELGDAVSARDQYAALVPVRERVQGPDHPDTLTARANLAYWTGRAGDAAGARDLCAALLPVRARVLGRGHPATLTTRAQLAHWTARARRL